MLAKAWAWFNGPAQWWEIWKAQNGTNLFFTGLLVFTIVSILAYLWS